MAVNQSKTRDPRFKKSWGDSGAFNLSRYNRTSARFKQKNHPEKLPDEAWIANCWDKNAEQIRWKTKRVGKVAYDREGRPIADCFPVFVSKAEIQQHNSPNTQKQ